MSVAQNWESFRVGGLPKYLVTPYLPPQVVGAIQRERNLSAH